MSLYAKIAPRGPSGFGYGTTAEQVTEGLSLAGKTLLVTGCNSGLGLETLRVLALRGARVIGTARSLDKARSACASVSGTTVPLACELSDPVSVRACVAAVKELNTPLDAIVCNAGIMALPTLELAHGVDLQLFTNHIGHFLLVTELLDRLSDTGRVVVVSSDAHRRAPPEGIQFDNLDGRNGYDAWRSYGQSKFANILFAKQLARRFAGTRKTANALHPGVIQTGISRRSSGLFNALLGVLGPLALKTIPQGAATQVYAATHPSLDKVTGQYLANCNVGTPRPDTDDEAMAKRLWEVSESIVARLPAR